MKTLEKPAGQATSFNEKISFTADGVAFRRAKWTDIPYSKEIWEIIQEISGPISPEEEKRLNYAPQYVPMFESRYIITDEEFKKSGIAQVLEIASGLSPRGFDHAHNPAMEYVELDLPDKMAVKRKVVGELHKRQGTPGYSNHHLLEGSGSSRSDMARVAEYFGLDPVFVTCEGLLRYMDWNDKKILTESILKIIKGDGMWVTPDIELLSNVNATAESRARYEKMAAEFGFDVRPNLFDDMDHALSFFEKFGLKIEQRPHIEMIPKLVSPGRLDLPEEVVRDVLEKRTTFVMTLR